VTLRRWRERLAAHADRLPALGFDDQLRRLFEFYLAYCEAAFLERHVSVVQLALAKPGWHGTLGETPGVASLRWTPPTAA
jgi:cyclopropane-fatty-acyl-phospholipid synthase